MRHRESGPAALAAPGSEEDRPVRCLTCGMTDPPPEMTCTGNLDHMVGGEAGCPACLRPMAACTARPCRARRGAR